MPARKPAPAVTSLLVANISALPAAVEYIDKSRSQSMTVR